MPPIPDRVNSRDDLAEDGFMSFSMSSSESLGGHRFSKFESVRYLPIFQIIVWYYKIILTNPIMIFSACVSHLPVECTCSKSSYVGTPQGLPKPLVREPAADVGLDSVAGLEADVVLEAVGGLAPDAGLEAYDGVSLDIFADSLLFCLDCCRPTPAVLSSSSCFWPSHRFSKFDSVR